MSTLAIGCFLMPAFIMLGVFTYERIKQDGLKDGLTFFGSIVAVVCFAFVTAHLMANHLN